MELNLLGRESTRYFLLSTFILVSGIAAGVEPVTVESVHDLGDAVDSETIHVNSLSVDPSQEKIAIRVYARDVRREYYVFSVFDDVTKRWLMSPPRSVAHHDSRRAMWKLDESGREYFSVDDSLDDVFGFQNLEPVETSRTMLNGLREFDDAYSRDGSGPPSESRDALADAISELDAQEYDQEAVAFVVNRVREAEQAIGDVYGVLDVVLLETLLHSHEGLVLGVNLRDGTRTRFEISGRDRHVDFTQSRFSPDGRYVLVHFAYGPDNDRAECPGYLQLFDVEGNFVQEVAKFESNDVSWDFGFSSWLKGDWLVYVNNGRVTFCRVGENN